MNLHYFLFCFRGRFRSDFWMDDIYCGAQQQHRLGDVRRKVGRKEVYFWKTEYLCYCNGFPEKNVKKHKKDVVGTGPLGREKKYIYKETPLLYIKKSFFFSSLFYQHKICINHSQVDQKHFLIFCRNVKDGRLLSFSHSPFLLLHSRYVIVPRLTWPISSAY